jgi:DNA replication and repair protein RecF
VFVTSIAISDFRNITTATIELPPSGTTVITGRNGSGKTNLLEAVSYLSTLRSFRGSPKEAMVRSGSDRAILRAATQVGDRAVDIEAELARTGRSLTMVNRQTVRRRSDLHQAIRVTVFSPEDIGVVRSGPSERRRFLDETLTVLDPRLAGVVDEVEKILRQRAALLRRSGNPMSPEVASTLDVWDARLDSAGTTLVEARERLVDRLTPVAQQHYSRLAGTEVLVGVQYQRSWTGGLADALGNTRRDDTLRGSTSVGPHRDEVATRLAGLIVRTQASQGEQRCLALALRLAAHQLATEQLGTAPVLLLDDVFSELDPYRSRALLAGLPPGQCILTTAHPLPPEVEPAAVYVMEPPGVVTLESIEGAR